jgi:hypothetical protein
VNEPSGEKDDEPYRHDSTIASYPNHGVVVKYRSMWITIAVLLSPAMSQAQHGAGASPNRSAPREASQFNFLLGQWDLTVTPASRTLAQKVHGMGKLSGTWKAWRVMDGWGIEDELRIIDGSGNPMALSHAVRLYDAASKKWKTSTLDPYRGLINASEAEWRQSQMNTSSRGADPDGRAYLSRSRYTDIKAGSFRFIQERSTDGGKTWKENLTIEAKRVSATAAR